MKTIDLNADLGEADTADWAKSEYDMLQYISSANIACGGHAGTKQTMKRIVSGAILNGVSIGAHPAYPDKVHFGRKSLTLGTDCLLYTSPSPRDATLSRMPSSA